MLYLIRVGEISLKGGNRGFFEKKLTQNIKRRLKSFQVAITGSTGRFLLEAPEGAETAVKEVLSTTFGIVGFSRATVTTKTLDDIRRAAFSEVEDFLSHNTGGSFKIAARRSDKSFPCNSYEIASTIGDEIRGNFTAMSVNVHEPDLLLNIEVRDRAYVYGNESRGPGGLPVGVAGRGMLLLSGGIDSPVAAYLMAKRGLGIDAVYFHTYPYTPDETLEKVKTITEKLASPCCGINLWVVPFTDVALKLRREAPSDQTTLLMRAGMMDAASRIAGRGRGLCLITGESLSQVASQTAQSMRFTESPSTLPVFRPLVALDKEEIINIARKIDTYDTSILPYDDCCTVFSPEKPLIRPDFELMRRSYQQLEIEEVLEASIRDMKKLWFPPKLGI